MTTITERRLEHVDHEKALVCEGMRKVRGFVFSNSERSVYLVHCDETRDFTAGWWLASDGCDRGVRTEKEGRQRAYEILGGEPLPKKKFRAASPPKKEKYGKAAFAEAFKLVTAAQIEATELAQIVAEPSSMAETIARTLRLAIDALERCSYGEGPVE